VVVVVVGVGAWVHLEQIVMVVVVVAVVDGRPQLLWPLSCLPQYRYG
jgi:hypothetical protein